MPERSIPDNGEKAGWKNQAQRLEVVYKDSMYGNHSVDQSKLLSNLHTPATLLQSFDYLGMKGIDFFVL